ncbi:MAG TPA: hypothetical protein VLT90_07880 [Terriglobales bacterium]|nr:hypothetical protein [Terriglobales bacterium]
MTTLIGFGWQNAKKYLPAALTIVAMRVGLLRVLSVATYSLAELLLKFMNFIIRRGFPDHLLLNEQVWGAPWQFHVRNMAAGFFVLGIGMLLGLWTNLRGERKQTS